MNFLPSIIGAIQDNSYSRGVIAALAVVVMIVIVMNMRRRRPYDGSPREYRREIDAATAQGVNVQRSMEDLLIELQELSRKISAQVDTRFAKLEQSIADADKRISALRILIDAAKKAEEATRGSAIQPPPEDPPTDAPPAPIKVQAAPDDARYRAVYDLADQGMAPLDIARQVGQRVGEIELILNLRPK